MQDFILISAPACSPDPMAIQSLSSIEVFAGDDLVSKEGDTIFHDGENITSIFNKGVYWGDFKEEFDKISTPIQDFPYMMAKR